MKVLLISKYFPPNQSARSYQIGKVRKAIEKCGGDVRVVAGINGKVGLSGRPKLHFKDTEYIPYSAHTNGKSIISRGLSRIISEFNSVNSRSSWVLRASEKAIGLIDNWCPDVLMTSSTPFESHLVGLKLIAQYKIPWVASFSDPWPPAINPLPHKGLGIPIIKQIQMHHLGKVLKFCDSVHMPSKYGLRLFEKFSQNKPFNKGVIIPHIGSEKKKESKINAEGFICHIGHLSRERVSRPLLNAIRNIMNDQSNDINGLLLVGRVCPEFKILVEKYGLTEKVRYAGTVNQAEAMDIASKAKALLLLEADMKESPYLPSKFADYAQVGRPIIAVTPKTSQIRDYLDKYSGGISVLNSELEITVAIRRIILDKGIYVNEVKALAKHFSSKKVGFKYMDVFNKII